MENLVTKYPITFILVYLWLIDVIFKWVLIFVCSKSSIFLHVTLITSIHSSSKHQSCSLSFIFIWIFWLRMTGSCLQIKSRTNSLAPTNRGQNRKFNLFSITNIYFSICNFISMALQIFDTIETRKVVEMLFIFILIFYSIRKVTFSKAKYRRIKSVNMFKMKYKNEQ